MAFLMISENYLSILAEQLFTFSNTLLAPTTVDTSKKLDLYLNDDESAVETLSGFPLSIFCSSLLLV